MRCEAVYYTAPPSNRAAALQFMETLVLFKWQITAFLPPPRWIIREETGVTLHHRKKLVWAYHSPPWWSTVCLIFLWCCMVLCWPWCSLRLLPALIKPILMYLTLTASLVSPETPDYNRPIIFLALYQFGPKHL